MNKATSDQVRILSSFFGNLDAADMYFTSTAQRVPYFYSGLSQDFYSGLENHIEGVLEGQIQRSQRLNV